MLCLALLFTATPILVGQASTAVIWTDKADYIPGETVTIFGSGFNPNAYYDVPVIRPDGNIVLGDGSDYVGYDTIQADENGDFIYQYILNGIEGFYEVRVYGSPWSGDRSEVSIATTTFTDGPVGNLLKEHRVWDPLASVQDWVPGHPKGYRESDVAAFRVQMGSDSSPVTANTEYDFYIWLDLDVSASGYGFTDIEPWDTTYQQDGTHLTPPPDAGDLTGGTTDAVRAAGATIDSVTGPVYDSGYQVWFVTFTTLSGVDYSPIVYVVYGGHIAAAGDTIAYSGDAVPAGMGASAIKGTFQARISSTGIGDKTVNFAGSEIAPLLGAISGYKWEDNDGDGNWDTGEGELALEGWTIELWNADGTVMLASATTGDGSEGGWPLGYYRFTDLAEGTYRVYEGSQGGWTQSYPAAPGYHTITLAAGEESQDNNFGNFENVDITVCKKIDDDGSLGTTDDQTDYDGWTVYLWKDGGLYDTQTTGASGCYTWTNLGPGSYEAREDDPSPEYTALTALTHDFGAVSSGESYSHTFVNFENVDITVYKYRDLTGNGYTADDTPLLAWTVRLFKDSVQVGSDQVTDGDGKYTWSDLGPGSYSVGEDVPAGWIPTSATSHDFGTVTSGGSYSFTFTNYQVTEFTKYFSDSGAFGEDPDGYPYTEPLIIDPETTRVFELKSGPRIWWEVTYTITNDDDEGHYYSLWDKWGGNLLVLDSPPTGFTLAPGKKAGGTVELENSASFSILYDGYYSYVQDHSDLSGLASGAGTTYSATMTMHQGDQQEGTNPGKKGKGTDKDSASYDIDISWYVYIPARQVAYLKIYIAPGINPGGQLQFTSWNEDGYTINTGPRVRIWADETYADFLYSWTFTNQLHLIVWPDN